MSSATGVEAARSKHAAKNPDVVSLIISDPQAPGLQTKEHLTFMRGGTKFILMFDAFNKGGTVTTLTAQDAYVVAAFASLINTGFSSGDLSLNLEELFSSGRRGISSAASFCRHSFGEHTITRYDVVAADVVGGCAVGREQRRE